MSLDRRRSRGQLEVHEHSFTRGPRAYRTGNWPSGMGPAFVHSHEGGDKPHEHPDTGPASYTIDKDAWARATGLKGGGRKKFTVKPSGEQFALVPRAPRSFDVYIIDSAQHSNPSFAGGRLHTDAECLGRCGEQVFAAAERMKQAFGMTARVHDLRRAKNAAEAESANAA